MLTTLYVIIFLNCWTIISNFVLIPHFNMSNHLIQNVQRHPKKQTLTSILTWSAYILMATSPLLATLAEELDWWPIGPKEVDHLKNFIAKFPCHKFLLSYLVTISNCVFVFVQRPGLP